MLITTYQCDHCGHTQNSKDAPRKMWYIGIFVEDRTYSETRSISNLPARLHAMWCRECCDELQLVTLAEKPPIPPPTIEDLLREIIREEIG